MTTPSKRPALSALLEDMLRRHRVSSALVVGGRWPARLKPRTLAEHQRIGDLRADELPRVDLALLFADGSVAPSDAAFDHLLARLRDLHAARLIVAVSQTGDRALAARWAEHLRSLGLEGLTEADAPGARLQLFQFDLASYKRTPDWLNPRNWANPENWGRFRW